MVLRHDGRKKEELRFLNIETNPLLYPKSSVEIQQGATKILCSLEVEKKSDSSLNEKETSDLKVVYHFLPFASKKSEQLAHQEEEAFLVRSLKSALDFTLLPYQLTLYCEVVQDGGSVLSVAVNGAFTALKLGLRQLLQENKLVQNPLIHDLAAVECGILANKEVAVDLDIAEERNALVKMTLVMTEEGDFVEMKISGYKAPFTGDILNGLLFRGKDAIETLISKEKEALQEGVFEKEDEVLVVATKNPGKAKEFARLFAPLGFKVKTLLDFPELKEVPETGLTFEENARLKAENISGILQQTVLADDSGLKVDALDGLPGIYSARFAGPQKSDASNNAKLLAELAEVPKGKRQAQFYCALAVASPGKKTLTVHGIWQGEIATIPTGDNGFGYDPLFYLPELNKTAAQLTDEEKNQYSHRSQALKVLQEKWTKL